MALYDLAGDKRKQNLDLFTNMSELAYKKWQQGQEDATKREQFNQLKQIYGITPEGGLGVIGQVPRGSQVVVPPATQISMAQEKAKMPTADMKNALTTTRQAKSLINSVVKQSESLEGGYAGAMQIGKAAINRGAGSSAKYRTYLSTMPATAVSIYRAVTGDTRLSDSDAQARAYPLLWHPNESVDVRKQKNDYIQSMVLAREALLSSGKFQSDKDGNAITDMGNVSAMAEKISAAKQAGYTDEEISAYYGGKNGE
jgi:hypothetical protein